MTDRAPIEVEVVCPDCRLVGAPPNVRYREGWCHFCVGTRRRTVFVAPGSLDEALHRLGLAAEEDRVATKAYMDGYIKADLAQWTANRNALYAAKGRCRAAFAEVRRLREAGNV